MTSWQQLGMASSPLLSGASLQARNYLTDARRGQPAVAHHEFALPGELSDAEIAQVLAQLPDSKARAADVEAQASWQFVKVYADKGITGTSTKHRAGFQQMVTDALDGKIDLIITKSVSHFVRNTVDSLTTVRALKDKGVEVFFEKEGIWTFDAKGELLITIMSSLAQEEARSISENVTWGHRNRFADGKVTVPYSRFLGYDKGEDGSRVINPEQAKTVRQIYDMYLGGMSIGTIARTITDEPETFTAAGNKTWHYQSMRTILTNVKHKGDTLLQKSYIVDYLTKRQVINQGEVPQHYVTASHEAISSPAVSAFVQAEIAKGAIVQRTQHRTRPFSATFECSQCGHKYAGQEKCTTGHISDQRHVPGGHSPSIQHTDRHRCQPSRSRRPRHE